MIDFVIITPKQIVQIQDSVKELFPEETEPQLDLDCLEEFETNKDFGVSPNNFHYKKLLNVLLQQLLTIAAAKHTPPITIKKLLKTLYLHKLPRSFLNFLEKPEVLACTKNAALFLRELVRNPDARLFVHKEDSELLREQVFLDCRLPVLRIEAAVRDRTVPPPVDFSSLIIATRRADGTALFFQTKTATDQTAFGYLDLLFKSALVLSIGLVFVFPSWTALYSFVQFCAEELEGLVAVRRVFVESPDLRESTQQVALFLQEERKSVFLSVFCSLHVSALSECTNFICGFPNINNAQQSNDVLLDFLWTWNQKGKSIWVDSAFLSRRFLVLMRNTFFDTINPGKINLTVEQCVLALLQP